MRENARYRLAFRQLDRHLLDVLWRELVLDEIVDAFDLADVGEIILGLPGNLRLF